MSLKLFEVFEIHSKIFSDYQQHEGPAEGSYVIQLYLANILHKLYLLSQSLETGNFQLSAISNVELAVMAWIIILLDLLFHIPI